MKTKYRNILTEMGPFLLFWSSQSFSSLGSAMTGYALVIWSYTRSGSALRTAMLMVSTYAPYVLLSIFAGALSDRWNKKIQFFTIPVGYLLGDVLVDYVFEPIMARQTSNSILILLFGMGKGSGTAFLFGVLGIAGVMVCLYFQGSKHIRELEEQEMQDIK